MVQTFTASVKGWSDKAKRNAGLILKQSTQDVLERAQTPVAKGGRMPVDTGFLRNSLSARLLGGTSASGSEAYIGVIAGFDPGDNLIAEWTAGYAAHVEFGARGRPPRRFAGAAAAQWQAIVRNNAAKLRD